MAVNLRPRTQAPEWTAGTDPFTRDQMNAFTAALETNMAIDGQGTLAARPAFGVRGRYYFATDNGILYRDTGSAWVSVPSTLGGVTPGAVADAGAEGSSASAARADHVHALHPQTARKDQAQTFTAAQTINGGTTATDRLNLGADVTLYRFLADVLRTEDRLEAADGFVEDLTDHGTISASPFTPDCRAGTTQRLTLGANLTINAPTNPPASGKVIALTLLLKQDATGNRTATWAAAIKWGAAAAPVLTTTAGRTDVVALVSHDGGANWLGFLGGLNFAY